MKVQEIKGKKLNMSQIFRQDGVVIPVTYIQVDDPQFIQEDLKDKNISVTGISKGRGFAGGMKRYGFKHQHVTRGSSSKVRAMGSLGCQTPSRVFKGKRMPGHYGNEQVTIHGLRIVDFIKENSLILVSGSVPGARNSKIILKIAQ